MNDDLRHIKAKHQAYASDRDSLVSVVTHVNISVQEYHERFQRVRSVMRRRHLDALLITTPENIFYMIGLSHQGYFAFNMLVVPPSGDATLVMRQMESATVIAQAPYVRLEGFLDNEGPERAVVRALKKLGLDRGRIGVEVSSSGLPPRIWEAMQAGLPGVQWYRDRYGIVDRLRLVKSPVEIDYIRKAAGISDYAVEAGLQTAQEGGNEKDVAASVYYEMIKRGGDFPGFAPLIRSAEIIMHEHVTWRDRPLNPGDNLFMELSGCVRRYHAPLTRMAFISRAPEEAYRIAAVAQAGLTEIERNLNPGVTTGHVYEAWETAVSRLLGRPHYRRHHCGYAVGIGFPPSWVGGNAVMGIRPGGKLRIREGMVFHIISWVAGPDFISYVISDTALVTPDGAEVLTKAPRDLVVR